MVSLNASRTAGGNFLDQHSSDAYLISVPETGLDRMRWRSFLDIRTVGVTTVEIGCLVGDGRPFG